MSTSVDIITRYLQRVVDGVLEDAKTKGQRIPSEFSINPTENSVQLIWPKMKWLILGRGPGKFPPPEAMLASVQSHPEMLEDARKTWKKITEQSLAYLIGRKIALKGTDIFLGKRPGIDLLGVMEKNMPNLLKELARNRAIDILTNLQSSVNR